VSAIDIVRRAHQTSLLGALDGEAPYQDLGGVNRAPYDLNAPGNIAEVKDVLRALGAKASSEGADETRYQAIRDDAGGLPTWDPASADELVLTLGRYRDVQWLSATGIEEPWWVQTPVGPQPTATGLEMLAGAAGYVLGQPMMPGYLAWRGGYLTPPSRVSGPSATDPVIPVSYYGPDFIYTPPGAPEPHASGIASVEAGLLADWSSAAAGTNAAERVALAASMVARRALREALIRAAIAVMPPREGSTSVEHVDEQACAKASGTWDAATGTCTVPGGTSKSSFWLWLIGMNVGMAGVYWLTRKRRVR
jgi:hypothetical protein